MRPAHSRSGNRTCLSLPTTATLCFAMMVAWLGAGSAPAADWHVGCARDSSEIVVGEDLNEQIVMVVSGPFPGRRAAGIWVEEGCPEKRCAAAAQAADEPTSWIAGELSSAPLGGCDPRPTPGSAAVPAGSGGLVGPGTADLNPLINTATAAARTCPPTFWTPVGSSADLPVVDL